MKIATLRQLPPEESAFVLGSKTLQQAAKGLNLNQEALMGLMQAQLGGQPPQESKLATVLEFLIELIGMRFVLHKMGLLLFNLENSFFGNWFLAIEIGGEYFIPVQTPEGIALDSLQAKNRLFCARSDRPVVELLLYLNGTEPLPRLELLEADKPHSALEGSRISLPQEQYEGFRPQAAQLKEQFEKEKQRLDQLEALFVEGFASS